MGALEVGKQYELLPNRAAQDYLSRIGNSLIPGALGTSLDGDPLKIPFLGFTWSQARSRTPILLSELGAIVVNS